MFPRRKPGEITIDELVKGSVVEEYPLKFHGEHRSPKEIYWCKIGEVLYAPGEKYQDGIITKVSIILYTSGIVDMYLMVENEGSEWYVNLTFANQTVSFSWYPYD